MTGAGKVGAGGGGLAEGLGKLGRVGEIVKIFDFVGFNKVFELHRGSVGIVCCIVKRK